MKQRIAQLPDLSHHRAALKQTNGSKQAEAIQKDQAQPRQARGIRQVHGEHDRQRGKQSRASPANNQQELRSSQRSDAYRRSNVISPQEATRKRESIQRLLISSAPSLLAIAAIAFGNYVLSIPSPPSLLETYGQLNQIQTPGEARSDQPVVRP